MAKEVSNVKREMRQQHKFALKKEVVEVECDDGSAYVFERVPERKSEEFRLARRVKPSGAISTSKAALPGAVKEAVETMVSGWHK